MSKEIRTIEEALEAVVEFRNERGWESHHTPKELASALSIEASELEELLWKDPEAISQHLESPEGREGVRDEIGDVLIYALLFCESAGIDPLEAIKSKLEKNEQKYPADEDHDF